MSAASPALSSSPGLPLLLRAMRLPTIAREHDEAIRRAEAENWGYARFLAYLFEAEANDRLQRKIQRQLKESNLPAGKTIESLDEKKLPDKIRRQLPTLLEADFVRRGDNLLCFGLAGRGKTHLVAAIAREWICRHQLQVLFVPAFRLVTQLLAAKRDLKLPQAIARLQRFDAVVIDDIGYVQQSREEMEVLFHFLAERYEKKSLVITSNLVFSQWDQIFKDPMTTHGRRRPARPPRYHPRVHRRQRPRQRRETTSKVVRRFRGGERRGNPASPHTPLPPRFLWNLFSERTGGELRSPTPPQRHGEF
jgi:DNA replication protein DnaC